MIQDSSIPILETRHLSKSFPGQKAVDDVSLTILSGEVHALLGQNGSGKSTFIKMLSGFHTPDPGGEIVFMGEPLDLGHVGSRHALMRFIHQDLGLVDTLDAVDNLALGRGYQTNWPRRIDWGRQRREVRRLLATLGIEFDIRQPVGRLAPVERTMVAVARAIADWSEGTRGLLVLDEPTVSLPAPEVERLFATVRRLVAGGIGVLYVSHRLDEVFTIADRASVLRDGRLVGTRSVAELDHDGLVEMIVGRRLATFVAPATTAGEEVVMRVSKLAAGRIQDLSMELRAGEIVGLTGLVGSGMEDAAEALFGAQPISGGTIELGGVALSGLTPSSARAHGIGLVPADRNRKGCIPEHSVRWNMTLPDLDAVSGPLGISRAREDAVLTEWIERVDLRPPDPDRLVKQLSGGNAQKVVIAKWLRTKPRVLLLHEPTQGVDVGAKAAIWKLLVDSAATGAAILVCSSDVDDLPQLCQRVLVMRDGRCTAELTGERLSVDALARATLARDGTTAQLPAAAGTH